MNEKAEKKFVVSWMNANQKLHQISNFRNIFFQFEEDIEKKYRLEAVRLLRAMKEGSEFDKFFIDKEGFFDAFGGDENLIERMAVSNVASTKNLFNASILVFVHSVFDGFLFDMIKVVIEISPKSFYSRYKNNKIKFSEFQKDVDDLIVYFIKKENLERKSLLEKINILFNLCKPPEGFSPIKGYLFDIDEIKKMDRLRHEVVHQEISNNNDSWVFDDYRLSQTLSYFLSLVNYKFKVKINPKLLEGAFARKV